MGHVRVVVQPLPEHSFPSHTNMIISQSLANRLRLPDHPVWVTFGTLTDTAYIYRTRNHTPLIRISSRLAHQLKMETQKTLHVRYDSSNRRLRFGPLLGILMNTSVEGNDHHPFGLMARFLEECAQASLAKGICMVVFSPENLNPAKNTTTGWEYQGNRWRRTESPLPDAIYNRITSRRIERKPDLQQRLEQLKKTCKIPVFNETFLNKQQVYDLLVKDEQMRRLLPESHPYQPAILRHMLKKYRTVYLKPTNGSLGHGIIRVMISEKKWVIQYSEAARTVTRIFSKPKEAIRQLRRKVVSSRYIIQRGLDLITYEGRPVDFRVLVQKNGQGKWSVTSTVGRIANDRNIVSNLARGGTLRKASEILSSLQLVNKPNLRHIQKQALSIAEHFESLSQGHFAELGVDLVLDQTGRLWLIELNSKPSKTDETVTSPSRAIRPSVNRLIEYVTYITGWNRNPTGKSKKNTSRSNRNRRKRR